MEEKPKPAAYKNWQAGQFGPKPTYEANRVNKVDSNNENKATSGVQGCTAVYSGQCGKIVHSEVPQEPVTLERCLSVVVAI